MDYNDSISELKRITSELKSLHNCAWNIVFLNYLISKKLRDENISCTFIDDYFFEEDHYYDYSQAIEISSQWFIDSTGDDATIYRGSSIGIILQRWFGQIWR